MRATRRTASRSAVATISRVLEFDCCRLDSFFLLKAALLIDSERHLEKLSEELSERLSAASEFTRFPL